jgi:FtsH-binding integral membrane protein
MAFAAAAHQRPIPGAVATLGVSDRVSFLRKTYAHLGISLIAFAAIAGGMMRFAPELSLRFSAFAFSGWNIVFTLIAFLLVGYGAERLARSQTSRGLQYLGLFLGVALYGLLLQPLLWRLLIQFGGRGAPAILGQSIIVTLTIFVGLTATVFITKKDFSFLRGALVVALFTAIGIALGAAILGFSLGMVYSGFVIMVMAGYILYETSMVMRDFPPTHHVAAALMLFSTVATMFFHVLRLIMALRD